MRGDSLRDLYAKTLALVGLGVLAGVGALFDYWPAGTRLVPVAPALELPDLAASFSKSPLDLHARTPTPAAQMRTHPPVEQPAIEASADVTLTSVSASEPLVPASGAVTQPVIAAAFEVPEPVAVLTSHAPEVALAEQTVSSGPGALVYDDLPGGQSIVSASWHEPISLVDADAAADDDGGFLSDALRKTRTSLVRTGARTGASIVDAVRVVSGVVRRALPN